MTDHSKSILVEPEGGRHYDMRSMRARFLADEDETAARYSISEWWLAPRSDGPGAHSHAEHDDIFYVLAGAVSFLIGENWTVVETGGFVRVGRGTVHDYRNDTDGPARILNIYIPGGFERDMPAIVDWFSRNP
jgi:quercetin dioxygenase-like cupin family protein